MSKTYATMLWRSFVDLVIPRREEDLKTPWIGKPKFRNGRESFFAVFKVWKA